MNTDLSKLAVELRAVAPDYFVRALRIEGRDEMVVMVASDADPAQHDHIRAAVEARLKERLGVRIAVDVVRPGALDDLTELATSPKPKRFRDER